MSNLQIDQAQILEEKRVLRWGGLSGIIGGLLFIIVFFIVGIFVGADPSDLDGWVARFPEIRTARTIENGLYLIALISWIPLFLALYRALRKSLAPALFGSVLGILGLVLLSGSALPHVPSVRLANIYHAPGATAVDQATIAHLWQLMWGIFDAMLLAGLVFMPIALVLLGVAMIKAPDFGKTVSWFTIVIGVVGLVAAGMFLTNPGSSIVAVSVISLILFHLVLGGKLIKLSNA